MRFLDKLRAMKDEAVEKLQQQTSKHDSPPPERRIKKDISEGEPVNE